MIKLYRVMEEKTSIKGYWKEKNKVYIDNIQIKECYTKYSFLINKRKLFHSGEKAVFYIRNNHAIIEDRQGNKTILKHCIKWNEKRITKSYLKELLKNHNGITIYKNKNDYTIELWKE